jgi:hypothetical protein
MVTTARGMGCTLDGVPEISRFFGIVIRRYFFDT